MGMPLSRDVSTRRRLALVTGGSRGLGASLCATYLQCGWDVTEFSRSANSPFSVRVDMGDPEVASNVFAETCDALAAQDLAEVVAIGSAATLGPVGPVERAASADIAAHVNVNVTSAMLFVRAFVAAFRDHDCPKAFVNISSGAAGRGLAGWSLYCASKAALEERMKKHPFRAFSVNPGVMDTAMQAEVRSASPEDFPDVQHYVLLHSEGGSPTRSRWRLGSPTWSPLGQARARRTP
jgi:benzil reductase ((S)-benzoin forming)